jgi:small subunit ribosomal protein S3
MRKVGDSSKLVLHGSTQAYLKAGVIGVTVKIVPPNTKFPDQLNVLLGVAPPVAEEKPKKKPRKKKEKTQDADSPAQETQTTAVTETTQEGGSPTEANA